MIQQKSNYINYLLTLLLPITILIGSFFLNLIAILISICVILYIVKYKNYNLIYLKENICLFFLFFVFILSSIFSDYKFQSFQNSFSYLSNILLFIGISFFIINDDKKKILLSKIVFIIMLFICFDLWFQSFLGENILGFPKQQAGRLTSIFKDEQIPGIVLFKLSPFAIYYLFSFKKNSFILRYKYLVLIFIYFSILITGERAASILSTLSLIFIIIYNFKSLNKKKIFLYLIIYSSIFVILFMQQNSIIKERVYYTYEQSKNNTYVGLYNNAFQIFKNNKLLGSGPQTYRFECIKIKGNCSTHPHNFLLELFSDGGIFAPILLILSLMFLIYFKIKKNNDKILNSLILSFTVLLFFPFIPTGSFFNSFHMTLTWFSLGFLYSIKKI